MAALLDADRSDTAVAGAVTCRVLGQRLELGRGIGKVSPVRVDDARHEHAITLADEDQIRLDRLPLALAGRIGHAHAVL